MEEVNCALCDSSEKKLLFKSRSCRYHLTDGDFSLAQCQNCDCDLVFLNPCPGKKEIGGHYPQKYYDKNALGIFKLISYFSREYYEKMKNKKINHFIMTSLITSNRGSFSKWVGTIPISHINHLTILYRKKGEGYGM